LLLHPAFHFGFIAMTFEQANLGHRLCDEQNLSDNKNFGGSNLTHEHLKSERNVPSLECTSVVCWWRTPIKAEKHEITVNRSIPNARHH